MTKKKDNRSKMPIYIPNQPSPNSIWGGINSDDVKEHIKEFEFQKKLALKNK